MMKIEPTCKYMLPCGLCELKKEPCSMFTQRITINELPLKENIVVTATEFNSSAQENKNIAV